MSKDLLLLTALGKDRPGISEACLSVLSSVELIEVSQLTIHGILIISFLIKSNKNFSDILKDFLLAATELQLLVESRVLRALPDAPAPPPLNVQLLTTPPVSAGFIAEVTGAFQRDCLNIEAISESFLYDLRLLRLSFTLKPLKNSFTHENICNLYQALGQISNTTISLRPGLGHIVPHGRSLLVFKYSHTARELLTVEVQNNRAACDLLRSLGFRLALLVEEVVAENASQDFVQTIKAKFGLDYVLEYSTAPCGSPMAKPMAENGAAILDLVRLLQAREKVSRMNLVYVGAVDDFLHVGQATDILIPGIFPDVLNMLPFLLGFSPEHVQELRGSTWTPTVVESSGQIVKITGRDAPGQLAKLMAALGTSEVSEVFQRNVHGVLCLVLRTKLNETTRKELLFAAHELDLKVEWETLQSERSSPTEGMSKLVVTVMGFPSLTTTALRRVLHQFTNVGGNIADFRKLGSGENDGMRALQISVSIPKNVEMTEMRQTLIGLREEVDVDIAIESDSVVRATRRLIVFDMDSTLIQQEVIDELAELVGVGQQIKQITELAMRGEIRFRESLARRVALLKGFSATDLFAEIRKKIEFTPGAQQLCTQLRKRGFTMAVISGGFLPIAEFVKETLGLDYAFANELEVEQNTGLLTGRTTGAVVTPQRKKALLEMIAHVEGCALDATIAVGDGANDIPMLQAAGLGVAFCAKPKVRQETKFQINTPDLAAVMYLLGLRHDE